MSERHVVSKTVGEVGFEDEVAAALCATSSGDVIAVPDAAAEKKVREAAVKFGLGVNEEEVGIGIEIMAGTGGEVEFDEGVLEYAVQAEDQIGFMAEVEDELCQPDFDDQTIFVVANRQEIGWLFATVAKYPGKVGHIRGTINATNVIVTSLEDLPEPPKLTVNIDMEGLSEGIKESLKKAGFAIGYMEQKGTLSLDGDDIYLMIREGDSIALTESILIGTVGEEVAIALPLPEGEVPDLKLTGAKPEIEKPTVEATPEHGTEAGSEPSGEVPESDEPLETVPDPARTEGKNVVDG